MSFILDALRKSDARRRMGQAPGLDSGPTASSARAGRGRRRGRLGLLLGVAVVLAVVIAVSRYQPLSNQIQQWVGSGATVEPAETVPDRADPGLAVGMPDIPDRAQAGSLQAEPVEMDEDRGVPRERVVRDPAEIDAELARLLAERGASEQGGEEAAGQDEEVVDPRSRPANPRTRVVAESPRRDQPRPAVDPRDTERMERLMRAREARLAEGDTSTGTRQPATGSERPAGPASVVAEPWTPGGPEYVRAWELPLSVRRSLPDLRLTIHVFAAEEDRRFVLVNGERYVTGDMITDSVRLVDIRREGAVVDFRDYRFLLEP